MAFRCQAREKPCLAPKAKTWYIFGYLMTFSTVWGIFLSLAWTVWIFRTLQLLKTLFHLPKVQPSGPPSPGTPDLVSIIVPMKNEAVNARACFEALKAQDYPAIEILFVNDNSTDETESILKSTGVNYINNTPTPPGWTGKNYAIHNGVQKAAGQWFFFTDADTRHETSSVSSAIAHMKKNNLELLTLLPRCLTGSCLERLIQPPAMAFLGLWFPIQQINDPEHPLYFANGQYLFMKRGLYKSIGGHEAVRGAFLEDFALMREAKKIQAPVQCALGRDIYGTRMYENWNALWKGWRRIYLHAFNQNAPVLLMRAVAVLLFSVMPFIAAAALLPSGGILFWAAAVLCAYVVTVSWQGYRIVRANPAYALLHPLASLFLFFVLLDAFWIAVTKGKTVWR
jgi:hypothetical protein